MKYTITDLQRDSQDDDACIELLKVCLYPDGIFCAIAKKITTHHKMHSKIRFSLCYKDAPSAEKETS
jgi:hypothetical protein